MHRYLLKKAAQKKYDRWCKFRLIEEEAEVEGSAL